MNVFLMDRKMIDMLCAKSVSMRLATICTEKEI